MSRKEIMMARTVTRGAIAVRKGSSAHAREARTSALETPPRAKLAPRYDAALLAPRAAEPARELTVNAAPDDDGLPPSRSTYAEERASAEPFGTWLIRQKDRGGLLGQLAGAAAGDRALSKAATPHDLRKRLVEQQADGDMHDALDDAEIDWLAL